MAVFSIDFNFIEKRKIYIEVSLDVFLDFSVVPWFLSHELVSRESENLEALGFIFLVEFHHLFIVV